MLITKCVLIRIGILSFDDFGESSAKKQIDILYSNYV